MMAFLTYSLVVQICYGWDYHACTEQVVETNLTYTQCMDERRYYLAGGRHARCRLEN